MDNIVIMQILRYEIEFELVGSILVIMVRKMDIDSSIVIEQDIFLLQLFGNKNVRRFSIIRKYIGIRMFRM